MHVAGLGPAHDTGAAGRGCPVLYRCPGAPLPGTSGGPKGSAHDVARIRLFVPGCLAVVPERPVPARHGGPDALVTGEFDSILGATTLEWQTPTPPPHGNFTGPVQVYRGPYDYSPGVAGVDFAPQNQRPNR